MQDISAPAATDFTIFTDNSVTAGSLYDYAVALNYSWPGGGGSGAGGQTGIFTTQAQALGGPFAASRVQPELEPTVQPVLSASMKNGWLLYPNPCSLDDVQIAFENQAALQYKVQIYDLLGELVRDAHGSLDGGGDKSVSIPVRNLASGIYLVRLELIDGENVGRVFEMKKLAILR